MELEEARTQRSADNKMPVYLRGQQYYIGSESFPPNMVTMSGIAVTPSPTAKDHERTNSSNVGKSPATNVSTECDNP